MTRADIFDHIYAYLNEHKDVLGADGDDTSLVMVAVLEDTTREKPCNTFALNIGDSDRPLHAAAELIVRLRDSKGNSDEMLRLLKKDHPSGIGTKHI